MKIGLNQIKTMIMSAPPESPSENELYIDDGTNTESKLPGWRIYKDGQWIDIGLQGLVALIIDGGTLE